MFRRLVTMGMVLTMMGSGSVSARDMSYDGWHAAGAPSRIRFRVTQDRVVELTGLSGPCGVPQLGPIDTVLGKVIKPEYASDAMTIVSVVLEEKTGVRRHFNLDADYIGDLSNADSGWVSQGLQMFLRPGNRVAVSYQMCGASGRLQMLDGIRLPPSR